MSRVGDLIILNLLCLVLSLPLVTIGPSLTALFYVELKMVRNEESYIVRSFFKSFKENFKQAFIINLIMLAGGGLLWVDFSIMRSFEGGWVRVLYIMLMVILFLYLMVFTYIYPVLSKFYNTIRNTFLNSFLMAIRHLPFTLLMILVSVLPFVAFFFGPATIQTYIIPVAILVGVSGVAFINAHFLVRIFDQYIPKEEEEEKEDAEDPADPPAEN